MSNVDPMADIAALAIREEPAWCKYAQILQPTIGEEVKAGAGLGRYQLGLQTRAYHSIRWTVRGRRRLPPRFSLLLLLLLFCMLALSQVHMSAP